MVLRGTVPVTNWKEAPRETFFYKKGRRRAKVCCSVSKFSCKVLSIIRILRLEGQQKGCCSYPFYKRARKGLGVGIRGGMFQYGHYSTSKKVLGLCTSLRGIALSRTGRRVQRTLKGKRCQASCVGTAPMRRRGTATRLTPVRRVRQACREVLSVLALGEGRRRSLREQKLGPRRVRTRHCQDIPLFKVGGLIGELTRRKCVIGNIPKFCQSASKG